MYFFIVRLSSSRSGQTLSFHKYINSDNYLDAWKEVVSEAWADLNLRSNDWYIVSITHSI